MSTPDLDRDIDLRRIAKLGGGLALLALVVHAAIWFLLVDFRRAEKRQDPPPSPLAEANAPRLPPGPRLQTDPVGEIRELRAEEEALLSSYGWVDRERGVVRIPIERAIEVLAARAAASGAQPRPAATAAAPAAATPAPQPAKPEEHRP
jgi:hypothetical protein